MGELYLDWEYRVTFVQLVMAMLAMGTTLHVRDFWAVVRLPRSFLTGLGTQVVLVPVIAFAVLRAADLDPGVAVGLAVLASVPGGTVSNVFTYAGRGDVPLSIALTAVTTLACIVTVPVVLDVLIGPFVPPGFSLPRGRIAAEIVATLLVPLGVGMVILRHRPTAAAVVSTWSLRATAVLIGVIVAGSAASGRLDPVAMGLPNLGIVVGAAVLMGAVGVIVPVIVRRPRPDVTAIAIEVTVRNTNLGLLIRATLFSGARADHPLADLALFTILAYAGASFAVITPLILRGRRRSASDPARAGDDDGPDDTMHSYAL